MLGFLLYEIGLYNCTEKLLSWFFCALDFPQHQNQVICWLCAVYVDWKMIVPEPFVPEGFYKNALSGSLFLSTN